MEVRIEVPNTTETLLLRNAGAPQVVSGGFWVWVATEDGSAYISPFGVVVRVR